MQNNAEKTEFETRSTVYMDKTLKEVIDSMADKKSWSFSHTCYVLLQYAIKEKQRKSRRKPDDHT
jgi:hypothetical protein